MALRSRGVTPVQFGQLADRALGKEGVDQPLPLVGGHEFHEQLALALHALGEGQLAAGLDAAHGDGGGQLATGLFQHRVIERVEIHWIGRGHLADGAAGGGGVDQLLRIGQADLARGAVLDLVDEAHLQRLGGADLAARGDHVERFVDADQPRQALGAAGARHHPDQNFGQAHPRLGHGDAIVRAERDLEPAAQRGAVQRRDHDQRRGFDSGADVGQEGFGRRLAEFADVGAGKERPSLAIDQHRLGAVLFGAFDPLDQPLPHRKAQRVDRRVVRRQNRDIANFLVHNGLGHPAFPSL